MSNIIYVLKSSGYDDSGNHIDLIKIGFSDNWSRRLAIYRNHNPTIVTLFTYEGGTIDIERSIQYYFRKFQFRKSSVEWFYYDKSIINFFKSHSTLDDMMKIIPFHGVSRGGKTTLREVRENILHLVIAAKRVTGVDILEDLKEHHSVTEEQFISYAKTRFKEGEVDRILEVGKTVLVELKQDADEILKFQEGFEKEDAFRNRLKYLCEFPFSSEVAKTNILDFLPECYKKFYVALGPEKCRAWGYNHQRLSKVLGETSFDLSTVRKEFLDNFKVGDKYPKSNLKDLVSQIYKRINYTKTPKATDLEDWFEIKACKVKDPSGKWVHGFEIIRVL